MIPEGPTRASALDLRIPYHISTVTSPSQCPVGFGTLDTGLERSEVKPVMDTIKEHPSATTMLANRTIEQTYKTPSTFRFRAEVRSRNVKGIKRIDDFGKRVSVVRKILKSKQMPIPKDEWKMLLPWYVSVGNEIADQLFLFLIIIAGSGIDKFRDLGDPQESTVNSFRNQRCFW